MKVIMEPIEMIAWFNLKGVLMSIKFRLETKNHELTTVKINKVLYHTEEKIAGNPIRTYACNVLVNNVEKSCELSTGANYIQDRALAISSKLINCSHRHIVFTIPEELRIFFRRDRSLLDVLFQASSTTILSWFHQLNKSESFKLGFVSVIHTFGRDLKWNPHIHILLTEGASGNKTIWRTIKHISFPALRKRWQATLLSTLHLHIKSAFYNLKTFLFKKYDKGFYVYAKPNMNSNSFDAIKYIIRYTGRPAMAQSRITNFSDDFITFYYDRHEDHKRIYETLHVFEFFKKLIIHIHDHQFKTIRYYGLYAKRYKHSKKLFLMLSKAKRKFSKRYSDWRSRILLSFGRDPLACTCGNTMKLLDIFIPSKNNPYLAIGPPTPYNGA